MRLKVLIHEAEEGGYWAEIPALPGCVTQGETYQEIVDNIKEVVELFLSPVLEPITDDRTTLLDIAV